MLWIALLLGLVEGLTEFLPVSSTGHLIVVSSWVGFTGKRAEVFQIFIQLGAILAVVWEYRARLGALLRRLPTEVEARAFVARLFLAFVPSAALGLAIHGWISDHLFSPVTVAAALIGGGIVILIVESLPHSALTTRAEAIGARQALGIGLAQCLALWPGFSRSAATILGGLGVGLDRRTATEFSFLLAIPTMFAATGYDLYKQHRYLEAGDAVWLALAFAVSFVVGWISVRWLLRFIAHHTFRPFAWYRLAVGLVILLSI